MTPVGDRGIVASWSRRTRACLRAGRCGQLSNPLGVATDGSGNVYVADANNSRIQKFDASGTFLMAWGSSGALGVATDGAGNVYVTEDTRVQKFACP